MTSSNVTPGSHVIGSALGMLSKTSASYYRFLALSLVFCPFPAILLAPSIITQKFILFGYVRGCCVVLQGCPRSHCGISKSQMNEMVNLIPTCIVSIKKLLQDDSSQFWKTMYILYRGRRMVGGMEGGGGGGRGRVAAAAAECVRGKCCCCCYCCYCCCCCWVRERKLVVLWRDVEIRNRKTTRKT